MGPNWDLFKAEAHRHGWVYEGAPATPGPNGGPSGGTGISTPRGRHLMRPVPGCNEIDGSPEGAAGRLSAAVVGIKRRDAILLIEAYLVSGESPFSLTNRRLLDEIAFLIAQAGLPSVYRVAIGAHRKVPVLVRIH